MEVELAQGGWSAGIGHRSGRLSITYLRREGVDLLAEQGCPLIAPWFGRLPDHRYRCLGREVVLDPADPSLEHDELGRPLHGLLSDPDSWTIASEGPAVALADTDAIAGERFPFPHRLSARIALGAQGLEVTTTLEAGLHGAVPVAFAWHPYLIADGDPGSWTLRLPFEEQIELVDLLPSGRVADRSTADEGLFPRDDCVVVRPGDQAELVGAESSTTLRFGVGYGWAMLWSPPGGSFLCVEPMAGPLASLCEAEPAVVVPAGGRHVASFAIG